MIGVPALDPRTPAPAAPTPAAPASATPAPATPATSQAPVAPQGLRSTMIGMPSPVRAPATPEPSAAPAGASRLDRTQIGIGAPVVTAAHPAASSAASAGVASPAPHVAHGAPADAPRPFAGTLIGIAHPGIAPRQPGVESQAPRAPSAAPGAPASHEAPTDAASFLAQRDSNPQRDSSPAYAGSNAARTRRKKPFPWLFVGLAFAAAASAGAAVALLGKKKPELTVVSFDMTGDGRDRLLVRCRHCAPGSKIQWGSSSAPLVKDQAHLTAPSRLHVGPNTVTFQLLDASGKQRELDVTVPIAFRVETELDGRLSNPPFATVVVEAPDGAEVTVDGKPVVGQAGSFRAAVSLAEWTQGESRERVAIQRNVPVRVVDKGTARDSSARLQTSVASLELATPAPAHVLAQGPLVVSGHTDPGALVRVGIQTTKADASGDFLLAITQPRVGPLVIGVEKDGVVSRFVQLPIEATTTRADSNLEATTNVGAVVNFTGNLVETKIDRGRTIAVLDAESGCAAPPCLLRIQLGQAQSFAPSRTLYGVGQLTGHEPLRIRAAWIQSMP